MGLKGIELDFETADKITAASLKDAWESTMKHIEESAGKFELAHHRENLRDYYRVLFALEECYNYYTGENLVDR